MIHEVDNTGKLSKPIYENIGRPISEKRDTIFSAVGSCLLNIRGIETFGRMDEIEPNARCNFELFENGLLLRINDKQKYYVLPLSKSDNLNITINEGEEMISPITFSGNLHAIGFKRSFLRKYWLTSGGFYNKRFELVIETDSEKLTLDSQSSNYKGILKFFEQSELRGRIIINNATYEE